MNSKTPWKTLADPQFPGRALTQTMALFYTFWDRKYFRGHLHGWSVHAWREGALTMGSSQSPLTHPGLAYPRILVFLALGIKIWPNPSLPLAERLKVTYQGTIAIVKSKAKKGRHGDDGDVNESLRAACTEPLVAGPRALFFFIWSREPPEYFS